MKYKIQLDNQQIRVIKNLIAKRSVEIYNKQRSNLKIEDENLRAICKRELDAEIIAICDLQESINKQISKVSHSPRK